ncbi:MAG TPA: hypothetical protein VNK04_12285 [Gemmataceae bacterium]|nr:hypothetical protein [Gemmataceae bacterium]
MNQTQRQMDRPALVRVLAALILFGVSFGFVEAAVVVYLRGLYGPIHRRVYPDAEPGALFPILLPEDLKAAGPEAEHWLKVELVREAATMVMLAAVALAGARNFRQWLAGFLIAFGVWDIAYYLSLKATLDWPPSLLTPDLLFLLPVPWAGPVLAPVLVALTMTATGVIVFRREAAGRPVRPRWGHWLAVLGGGLILVIAFCWDWRNLMSRQEPGPFNWPLFALGEGLGLAGFLHALWAEGRQALQAPEDRPASVRTCP